jgi:tetratricopeptide (TPR) repeat protein
VASRAKAHGVASVTPRVPVTVVLAVVAAVVASYAFKPDPIEDRAERTGASSVLGSEAASTTDLEEIKRLILATEQSLKDHPNSTGFKFVARLYLDRGRITGDAATYAQAAAALRSSLGIYPGDLEARTLLATVRLTQHDFPRAERIALDVFAADPGSYSALAVAGDAALEMGDYETAARRFAQIEAALDGEAEITVRRARLEWIGGNATRAQQLAERATAEARENGAFGSDLAWYLSFQGSLAFETGDHQEAERFYRNALRRAPGYHVALAGLGRSLAAQGDIAGGRRSYAKAVARVPAPEYLAALGDLYALEGDEASAKDQFATVDAIAKIAASKNQIYDRQLALFYADHDLRVRRALRLTRSELAVRKDVFGFDAHAWALYRNGRYQAARRASDRALSLGTPDARLLYHSGMISFRLREDERAIRDLRRALTTNPIFDLVQAPTAESTLSRLEGRAR